MRGFGLRLRLVAAIGTVALLVFGVIGISEAIKFHDQKVVSYDQFVKDRPQEGWYKITSCMLSIPEATMLQKDNRNDTAYVPVFRDKDLDTQTTYVVLETKDQGIMDTWSQIPEDEAQQKEYLSKNISQMFVHRDVEGMIKAGINADNDTRQKIEAKSSALDPNFVILQEGKHPSLAEGFGLFFGGVALLVLQVLYYARRRVMRA